MLAELEDARSAARPGLRLQDPIEAVAPDLFVHPAKDADTGEAGWRVELNGAALPKVLVDRDVPRRR